MLHPAIVATSEDSIHGICLVTNQPIREGEAVWELDEPTYTWEQIESWPAERRQAFDWYGFQCGVDRYSLPEGLSREMNHSCDPTTSWSDATTLVALRDIQAGEEITYDYSTSDIDSVFEMECQCGSLLCRGTISNRDYLNPVWQERYGSNLPPHVLAAIARARAPHRATLSSREADEERERGERRRVAGVSERPTQSGARRLSLAIAGAAALGTGIVGIGFGSFWAPTVLALFAADDVVQNFELVIPFMPISLIALGACLVVQSRQ